MRKVLLVILFIVIFSICFAQNSNYKIIGDEQSSLSFIRNNFKNNYRDSKGDTVEMPLKHRKIYDRWLFSVKNRSTIIKNDTIFRDFNLVNSMYNNYLKESASNYATNKTTINLQWNHIGPYTPWQTLGLISCVKVHPTNPDVIFAGGCAGGLFKTTDGGQNWTNITDASLILSPGIRDIAINPSDPNIMYIATGSTAFEIPVEGYLADNGLGVFKTTNGGQTWTQSLSFTPGQAIAVYKLHINPQNPNLIIALAKDAIYKTINGGTSWTTATKTCLNTCNSNNVFREIDQKPNSTTYYASTDNRGTPRGASFFVSLDNGSTWTEKAFPILSERIAIDVSNALPNRVYALCREYNTRMDYIYYSDNNGNNWTRINMYNDLDPNTNNYFGEFNGSNYWHMEIEVSDANTSKIYVGGTRIYKSEDAGATFTSKSQYDFDDPNNILPENSTHADIRFMQLISSSADGNSDVLVMGNDGGVARTTNGASTWNNLNGNGLQITQIYGCDIDKQNNGNIIIGCMDNGTFLRTNNQWQILPHTPWFGDGGHSVFANNSPNEFYGLSNYLFCRFNNTYINLDIPPYNNSSNNTLHLGLDIESDPSNDNNILLLLNDLWIYNRTTSLIESTPLFNNTSTTTLISAVAVSATGDTMYLALEGQNWDEPVGRFFKTVNHGQTWTDITAALGDACVGQTITSIAISNTDANKVWVGVNGYWIDNNVPRYRVLYSTNGSVFTELNTGLTPFSVNKLIYEKNSNGVVYAGTDEGVYYSVAGGEWVNIRGSLPITFVSDIDIDYFNNKIIASTYGRGLWEAYLPCTFNSTAINITTNTTWSTDKRINQNIFVKSGATLTITSEISLSSYSKIVIERGGKIVLNGGKLTNSCGERWKGIEVWGTSNKSQYILDLPYQGQLEIINGGKIENAEVAVFVGKVNVQGLNETGYEGGLVSTNGAFISNCKTGVVFNPYHNYNPANPSILRPNLSSFKNSTFETNSSWIVLANVYPEAFVKLTEVEGIYFRGCTFVNSVPDNFVVYRRGKGIVATDAYFYVDQYCPSTYPCASPVNTTFSNLYYAIDASKTWWDDVLSIKYATFNSNYRGIYISSMLNPIVMNNTFNIPDYDHSIDVILPTNNQPYGLYLNQSTGYTVENNSFNSSTSNKSTKHGVIVNYSGTANNRIYNNTFTALSVGTAAQGQNRGTNTGLVYKCNEFTNCNRDISIAPYSVFYGNVALYQGSLTEPAANLFSLAGTSFSDIYNESWTVNYYHNTRPQRTARWVPMNYSTTSITLFNTSVAYNKTAQCPVTGGGMNKNLINSYLNIDNYSSEIRLIENQLNNLVDGGNTMLLLNEVANTPSWDALNLRNSLLTKSPFLSDTVLISAVENESVLPPVMLTQVLTANPQGIKSEEVKESIENRQNVIPDYLMTEIENSRNYVSAKEHLESQLLMLRNKRAVEINSLITELKQDSLNTFASDSICSLMSIEKTKNTTFNQYLRMLQVNKLENAALYYNLILESNDDDLVFLATLARDLKSNIKVLDSLSSEDYLTLTQIANNEESSVKGIARNLMLRLNLIEYAEPIYEINTSEEKSKTRKETKNSSDSNVLKLYPNPAKDYLIVYYKSESENCIIEVCDMFGRNIYSQKVNQKEGEIIIETKSFISGNYFVKLQSEGNTIKTEKVSISNK